MNRIARTQTRLFALALLALPVACGGPSPGPHVHADDAHAERSFSGGALAEAFVVVGDHYVSPLLENEHGGTRVGFLVDVTAEAAGVHLEARGYDDSGAPGAWLPATFTWAEGTMRVGRVDLPFAAYAAEVRVLASEAPSLLALTYSLIVPGEGASDPGFDALASRPVPVDVAGAPIQQGLAIAGVNPRSAWGARATGCTSLNSTKTKISVHHTAGPSSPSPDYPGRLRGIQAYHMDSRGWCDVGYHFFVTKDGQQWEAREARFLGAHVANQNTNNLGIVTVGCWQTSGCSDFTPFTPPTVMVESVGNLVGKNATHYGISVSPSTVMGHRDNPGASTACPGDNMHAMLGEVRSIASGGGSTTPPPPATGKVQGVVWDLSVTTDASQSQALGARLEGATITCDCGETTTSRVDDAYWSFDLDPGTYTLTASFDGYASASREVQVTAGSAQWASIGVAPEATSASLTVYVHDAESLAPIEHAAVEVTGADPAQTNGSGEVVIAVNAGDLLIKAVAEGYEPLEVNRTVAAGADDRVEVALARLVVDPKDEEPENPDPVQETPETPEGDEVKRVVLKPQTASGDVAQGCVCVTGDSESGDPARGIALAGLLGLGLLLRRRRA